MNIHLILQMAADSMPDREAVICGSQRLTYQDLADAVNALADKLEGTKKLAYLAETGTAAPVAMFAAALRGTPYVPINYRLAEDQILSLLKRVSPALLISDDAPEVEGITKITPAEVFSPGTPWEGFAPDEEGSIAIELFTSGTTGDPKSAILRHDNLMAYILGTIEFMSAEESQSTLVSVPPYHIAGISAILSSVYAGRRMVQLPNFSPEAWLKLAKQENVSQAFLVPTMLQRIIEYTASNNETLDLPAMQAIAYGGGKMPHSVIEQAMMLMPHVNFTNAYGLTETSSTICLLDPDDHRDAFQSEGPSVRARLSSVGRPLPAVEVEIRDDDNAPCGAGVAGYVFVRGEQVSGEYHGSGSLLDENGWFPTRDRGYLDDAGYLFLDGRADDVIVRGGENISPGEIEDVLIEMSDIKDVAAVAVADDEWGEAVGVVIVPADMTAPPEIEAIKSHVKNQLRSSRVPTKVKFMEELPYNETGKLLRRVLRDGFST
tara:strand:- start:59 stop:1531 length:1473 start_codon:yes stop_codon:yes gene_type:complete